MATFRLSSKSCTSQWNFEARAFDRVENKVFVQGHFTFRHNVTRQTATSDWIARFEIDGDKIRGGQFFENTYAVAATRA